MTLRTLHLYGDLAKVYGKTHRVAANNLADAVRIVECNQPGIVRRVHSGSFHCLHGDASLKRSTELEAHQLNLPRKTGDFHLVPVAYGQGRTGKMIFTIIVGGALLFTGVGGAAMFGASGLLGAGAGGVGILGLSASTTALLGGSLLLGGISMLLTPAVPAATANKPTSFTFSGPAGSGDEGGPVPLVYGEVICSGVSIASDIRNGYGSVGYGGFGYGSAGFTYGGGARVFDHSFSTFNL